MSVDISCIRKCGTYTKYQDVHLLNGRIAKVAIRLDQQGALTGRTVYLNGGNVNVVYDGEKWIECNPCEVA